MTESNVPTLEYLHECFDYDPETGVLTWRARPQAHFKTEHGSRGWNTRYAGKVAGSPTSWGYLNVTVCNVRYRNHRIAFAMYNHIELADMDFEVDHKDVDLKNNRGENLRSATRSQNNRNQRKRSNNASGFKGVFLHKGRGYRALIMAAGKRHHLGYFPTPELAGAAYAQAAERLHGEFARAV